MKTKEYNFVVILISESDGRRSSELFSVKLLRVNVKERWQKKITCISSQYINTSVW